MDGSNEIFIVLPIVAIITLLILVGLPFLGHRQANPRHSGGGRSPGHQAQIPADPAAADASGSDAIGPGHA